MKLFLQKKLYLCSIAVFLFLLSAAFSTVRANDAEASAAYKDGLEKYAAKEYYPAAKKFLDAELLADSPSQKAEALKEAVNSYRQAKMYYKEFECVERLVNYYPSFIDFSKMVDREYEIGDEYYHGYRDPEFWALRWVPWLTGPDRAVEIYEKALKHAPFAGNAPQAKLRAAVLLIETNKVDKAMEFLRQIIKQHPDTPECKYAYLELGNALFQLSQKGDGDGKYNREALEVFNAFLTKYPQAPECDFVKKCLLKSKDINAQRLLGMAKFYQRIGRSEPAERYLNDVLKQYPDSLAADKSEEMLTKIDKTYVPEGFRPEVESRNQSFKQIPIPPEASPVMVVPENSDGKWLLPIKDLGIGKKDEKGSK
ncbi:MAG: outer membrane protein assembly factor BamD [Victivallaceae bacterium]|jgi:outer membrane assembly lipoprotein YfiO